MRSSTTVLLFALLVAAARAMLLAAARVMLRVTPRAALSAMGIGLTRPPRRFRKEGGPSLRWRAPSL